MLEQRRLRPEASPVLLETSMAHELVIGIAGSGGDGVVTAGESLMAAAASAGYYAMLTKSFGSQIRGGESSCRLRLSTRPIFNPGGTLDVAVVFNWPDFLKFGGELPMDGRTVVIYEGESGVPPDRLPLEGVTPAAALAVPIGEIARATTGTDRAKNVVVLGLLAEWLGIGRDAILAGVRKRFESKGPKVLEASERAFAAGLAHAAEHPLGRHVTLEHPPRATAKLLADGNDMCAAAAIFAGCQFFGGYPITPSTEIMQFLNREIWKYGGVILQAEDEIAGVGSAVGASFAGKKAMTATSGPGMALKTEILGLATIAELPLVVVDVQRGGPSTGIPTKSEQADLFQAVFSAHGDVSRPVLAPSSVGDTFQVTVEAFNIAEEFQTPVVVLSDQEIGQRKETVDPIDTALFRILERRRPHPDELVPYVRFRLTESGISPISHPGLGGGAYQGAGIEHTETGSPTASGLLHARMTEKRFRKLAPLQARRDLFSLEGDPGASLVLVSWGSSAGVCREALALAVAAGLEAKLLVPRLLYPVAEEVYREFLRTARAGLVVEQSYQGQLYRILRMFLDLPPGVVSMARPGANPFRPAEIVERLHELAGAAAIREVRPQERRPA
jgi:2-oxoglutarate ferredoxin oxidoreductase subunit alpha